jgi:hypothetical protein
VSKSPPIRPIVCIGETNGIEVNVFASNYKADGVWYVRPCVEIRRMNSVQMLLPDVEAVIDLLQEALAYWQEEGKG